MTTTPKSRPAHAEKQKEVDLLADRFKRAEVAVLAEVRGLTVDKVTELRSNLRKGKSDFKIVKNTLAKRALAGTKYEALKDKFKGPIAVALNYSDVVHPAKVLDQFVRDNDGKGLKIIGGAMGTKALNAAEVKDLASLPNLETSRSMLLGMFMQPAAGLARLLDAYRKKLEGAAGGASGAAAEAPKT